VLAEAPLPSWLAEEVRQQGAPSELSSWWLGVLFSLLRKQAPERALAWIDGGSIVEILRAPNGSWASDSASPFHRRFGADTRAEFSGPLAGHSMLQTSCDPSGRTVRGVLGARAATITPWGTLLIAEERLLWSRSPDGADAGDVSNAHATYGYVVEIDLYDPTSIPRKHSALGRLEREAIVAVITRDRHVAVYFRDSSRRGHVYRFVSEREYNANDRQSNLRLLESGTLWVSRQGATGVDQWLPLVHGASPLTADNGFHSQAAVLVNPRAAVDALDAAGRKRSATGKR
jgi:secreted PhoX family phosphatase